MKSSHAVMLALATALALGLACGARSVRFPHAPHASRQQCGAPGQPECLSCGSCHRSSTPAVDVSLPAPELCSNCHDEPEVVALAVRKELPLGLSHTIRFSHESHLEMKEIRGQCVPCHQGAARDDGTPLFPPMQRCFSCHEHQAEWDRGECAPCHENRDIRGVLPETFLRHDAGFSRRHGVLARSNEKVCAQCHGQSDCDDCHAIDRGLRVDRHRPEALAENFVHRGDFLVRHSVEATLDGAACLRCHTSSSCDDCHVERGVSANRVGARNPHPPGWVGSFAEGRSFHGREARRDVVACASCHDQGPATNCIGCHRVGAYGGNPHPSGWQSSRTPNETMCRYCHGG